MASTSSDASQALKELRDTLRAPHELDTDGFTFLLSSTLQAVHLHPTSVPPSDITDTCKTIERYLPAVQQVLLINAVPTYLAALDTKGLGLLERFFVPPRRPDPSTLALGRAVSLVSYSTITSLLSAKPSDVQVTPLPLQSREYVLGLAERLSGEYGIDELYWAVLGGQEAPAESSKAGRMKMLKWEEVVRAASSLPSRVANAWGRWHSEGWTGDISPGLTPRSYFDRLVVKLENLMYQESQSSADVFPLRIVFERLIALGLLNAPPSKHSTPTPSLLGPLLPGLLAHLHPASESPLPPYPPGYLPALFVSLPASALAAFTGSLTDHLALHLDAGPFNQPNESIKRAAVTLSEIIGPPQPSTESWDAVLRSVTRGPARRDDARVRLIVAWVGIGKQDAFEAFIDIVIDLWTDPKHIRYALYALQFELTHFLLGAIALLPTYHPFLIRLSHRPKFLMAMQSYLGHPDPAIRRLGMVAAEIVSERTIPDSSQAEDDNQADEIAELQSGLEEDKPMGKPKGAKRLKFGAGMWEGQGQGRDEARWLRSSMDVKDNDAILASDGEAWVLGWDRTLTDDSVDVCSVIRPTPTIPARPARPKEDKKDKKRTSRPKIVMLDEEQAADPMEGYDNASPSSSRFPSPTPSLLEEVTADPSLALDAAGKKKIKRPVYILQLMALLKERDKPDHLEVGLKWGESLIRSKRSFGKELEENAVQLATLTVALNDPFNLDDFDESRQGILNALVACSPTNVAPTLCELYFIGSYSLQQRSVILTALAMGARELAGMSVPEPAKQKRVDFPSKTLPPALHRKYISAADTPNGQIEEAIDGVRGLLLSKGVKRGEETVPELAREKRLRLGSKATRKVAEVGTLTDREMADTIRPAVQAPIVPFKDVAAESFILPLINRFWQHFQDASIRQGRALASGTRYRGAGTGLLLSPMALEKYLMTLALLLHAARHSPYFLAVLVPEALELAAAMGAQHLSQPDIEDHEPGKEASVVGAALELALVVLDASWDLDGGRTLAMDKQALLMGVGEWANGVFKDEERGGVVAAGQGGLREGKVRAAAAGVVVKVSDIAEKWGRLSVM